MSIYTDSIKFLSDHAPSDEHFIMIMHLEELKAACDNEIVKIGMELVESGELRPPETRPKGAASGAEARAFSIYKAIRGRSRGAGLG